MSAINKIYGKIWLVCLFCLYPKNVKTAELIGPNFFVEPCVTLGKVYEVRNLKVCVYRIFIFVKF